MKKQVKQRDEQTKQNTNANSNENRTPVSEDTKQKLVQQYADRAEQTPSRKYGADRQTIAEGSINPTRDTVYRVGADDPYGYYSQSQLNNNMSGTDANAIYQATHRQNDPWVYNGSAYDPYTDQTSQEFNEWLREEGLKPRTGAQGAVGYEGHNAYVAGADAPWNSVFDEALSFGVGSPQGIPREYLSNYGKHFLQDIDRDSEWYQNRKDRWQDYMNNTRRGELLNEIYGAPITVNPTQTAQEGLAASTPTYDDLLSMVNSENISLLDALNQYDPGYADRIQPNPLYGYGQSDVDSYGVFGRKGLDAWYDSNLPTEQDRAMMDRAFNLMQNYRLAEDDRYADQLIQDMNDQQLYGDALRMLQQEIQRRNSRSILDELPQTRLKPRKRNITGEGDWWSVNPNY